MRFKINWLNIIAISLSLSVSYPVLGALLVTLEESTVNDPEFNFVALLPCTGVVVPEAAVDNGALRCLFLSSGTHL